MIQLDILHEKMRNCTLCSLHKNRTQVVPGIVSNSEICVIGEAPGREEDRRGEPFVGRSGKLLDDMLFEIGLDRSSVSILNIVKCRPPENRDPTYVEIAQCSSYWLNPQLDIIKPKIVVTLGRVALNYFISSAQITKVAGEPQELPQFTLLPLFHPAYILRNMGILDTYKDHFKILQSLLGTPRKGQLNLDEFF